MKIEEIVNCLESFAPTAYQEKYDNSGLLVGSLNQEVTQAIISLDCTEDVIDEAIEKKCELIICHHPIIFGGLKKLTGDNYVERTVIKAIQHNIAIYAIHTNLDNVLLGVNNKISDKLNLVNRQILSPKKDLIKKVIVHAPIKNAAEIKDAMWSAGAGNIGNYENCSFNTIGEGTFMGNVNSNPTIGKKGQIHSEKEIKIEMIYPIDLQSKVLKAMYSKHPYEEVSYEIINLFNYHQNVGSGMIGSLEKPMNTKEFLSLAKTSLNASCLKYTKSDITTIQKVAVCGGSGRFLLQQAIKMDADIFISSDFKYHEFFDADNKIIIADVGHYESEQFTKELIAEILKEKFSKFATHLSHTNTNPINYL